MYVHVFEACTYVRYPALLYYNGTVKDDERARVEPFHF